MKATALLLVAVVAVVGLALASAPGRGLADSDIRVVAEEVKSRFPDGLLFHVEAQGPDPIEEVRVVYRIEGGQTTSYGYADITPNTSVSGDYLLRTSGTGNHIPPGTAFVYHLEITDSAGRRVVTPERRVVYMDSRFEWESLTQGPLTVYYYGPTRSRAETVLNTALQTINTMAPLMGIEEVKPIRIVAYNNYLHMSLALPPRSQAQNQELITEGLTWSDKRVTVLLAYSERVAGITAHELMHILVADAAGPAYGVVPAWLNEGLAEFANVDPGDAYEQALRYAIYTRRVKPLWYLREFPGDPDEVIIAYGQSRSVVSYMVNVLGPEKLAEFFRALRHTLDVDEALKQVYGVDQYGLDTLWREALGLPPLPPPEELEAGAPETPVPTPTPTPAPTPTPTPESVRERGVTVGCNIRPREGASLPVDLALVGLLMAPLALVALRRLPR